MNTQKNYKPPCSVCGSKETVFVDSRGERIPIIRTKEIDKYRKCISCGHVSKSKTIFERVTAITSGTHVWQPEFVESF